MKKNVVLFIALLSLSSISSYAQEAPPPLKMPRLPVHRLTLTDRKETVLQSRSLEGPAVVLDAERLKINNVEVRLFGIVPPQLSASFGPQARSALDSLIANKTVSCTIRDRDHEGRFLAACRTSENGDIAYELIRSGLAVSARGSIANTELASRYVAAEQEAQNEHVGLWSVVVSTPSVPTITSLSIPPSSPLPANNAEASPAKPDISLNKGSEPSAVVSPQTIRAPTFTTPLFQPNLMERSAGIASWLNSNLLRYQTFIASFLLLMTALSSLLIPGHLEVRQRRQELKAIAAALRGELMAARTVCVAKVRSLKGDDEDRIITWPKIRSTLYHAHLNRLGHLGSELARQISSIYGQAQEYATYYENLKEGRAPFMPKAQALGTIIHYIEAVLPRLAKVEETGKLMTRDSPEIISALVAASESQIQEAEEVLETEMENENYSIANDDVPSEKPAPAVIEKTAPAATSLPLWKAMRNYTRERISTNVVEVLDDPSSDYSTLIEEEAERITQEEEVGKDPAETAIIRIAKLGLGRS